MPSTNFETESKVEKAKTIVEALIQSLNIATSMLAMWEAANNDAELMLLFHHTHEGHGVHYARYSILIRLIMSLTKMHDHFDFKKTRTHNRASLPHLMHFLSDEDVRKKLGDEARHWLPDGFLANENQKLVNEKIAAVMDNYNKFSDGEPKLWLRSLKNLRDTDIAHNLIGMEFDRPKFEYLNNVYDLTSTIIYDARLAITGTHADHAQAMRAELSKARDFWSVLKDGMRQRKTQSAKKT